MILTEEALNWLKRCFPNLYYIPESQRIDGELDFCANFNKDSGRLKIGADIGAKTSDTYLCDVFEIKILLDTSSIRKNGWPLVFETGGKKSRIARENDVNLRDLHFYEDTGSCCLGIQYTREKYLTIRRFLHKLVIPFFYRLSYVDKYGLKSAKCDLWGEYLHGYLGIGEYWEEILCYANSGCNKESLCPCGSEEKYKNCCLADVELITKMHHSPGSAQDAGGWPYLLSLRK